MIFKKKFIRQFEPYIKRKYAKEVYKNIMKGNLGPGIQTKLIEEKIREITGSKNCICTTSGTIALMVAIKSLNLKPGSTILFPSYTFLAGANAARFMGYKVKLIDINPYTLCMDVNKLKFNKNVSCVIFVNHNAYRGDDIKQIKYLCALRGIPIVEDAAQSIGTPFAGKTGDIGIFSFSVPKLCTSSQGGAIITDDNKLAEKCRNIIDHGGQGWRQDRIHKDIGLNLRFNDILSSYLLPQLRDIKVLLEKRWQIFNNYYNNGICPYRFTPYVEEKESLWMVTYLSPKADEIIEALKKKNIEAVKYYRPINHNPTYKTKTIFPVAEKIYKELIYLPSSLNLKRREIKRICRIIKRVEEKNE